MSTTEITVRQRGVRFPVTGRGRVFSAHDRALNLALDDEPCLATLVTDPGLMTVSSVFILPRESGFHLSDFARNDPLTVSADRIVFGSGLTLCLRDSRAPRFTGTIAPLPGFGARASVAPPRAAADPGAPTVSPLQAATTELLRAIVALSGTGGGRMLRGEHETRPPCDSQAAGDAPAAITGFAPLAAGLLSGSRADTDGRGTPAPYPARYPTDLPGADPFARAAWPTVRAVLTDPTVRTERAERTAGGAGTMERLSALVGLGIGFTPSGDDLVVGFLAAEALVAGAGLGGAGTRPALSLLLERASKTTLPGATIVRQAAAGHFPAYLCRFAGAFAAACGGGDRIDGAAAGGRHELGGTGEVESVSARIRRAVTEAASHGHSSGIDALVGFALGGLLTLRET